MLGTFPHPIAQFAFVESAALAERYNYHRIVYGNFSIIPF